MNTSVSGLKAVVCAGVGISLLTPFCLARPAGMTASGFSTGPVSIAAARGMSGGMGFGGPRMGFAAPRTAPAGMFPARPFPVNNQWQVPTSFYPTGMPYMNSNTLPYMGYAGGTIPVGTLPVAPVAPTNPIAPGGPSGPGGGMVPGGGPGPGGGNPPGHNGQNCPVFCPPGWNWYPWGGNGCVLWNGMNYVCYWNGYPVPPYVPGPFGGMTYLYDPNLLPGATQQTMAAQSAAASAQQAPQYSAVDYGVSAFRDGQAEAAVKIFRAILSKDKEDTFAMRVLALALLECREPDNAAAMMRQAYKTDPMLASREVEVDVLGLSSARRSTLINRATEYANRVGSASGWLTVAVLMQADGRYELARRILKKSADEGLEPDIRKAFDAALAAKIRGPMTPRPVSRPAMPSKPAPAPAATPADTSTAPAEPAK